MTRSRRRSERGEEGEEARVRSGEGNLELQPEDFRYHFTKFKLLFHSIGTSRGASRGG
jgi:hypothetical protein